MIETAVDFSQIIIADLILSGDNALIIGMAAAGLSPELRQKAIVYGMVIAALLRVVFAVVATKLLGIPGLLFFGSILISSFLLGITYRLFILYGKFLLNHSLRWSQPQPPGILSANFFIPVALVNRSIVSPKPRSFICVRIL